MLMRREMHLALFQSTLRRTERPSSSSSSIDTLKFQSTLRRTERHRAEVHGNRTDRFQSTLRRTERPHIERDEELCQHISIHAPTNGATELTHQPFIVDRFQSTLRRTERLRSCPAMEHSPYFNPRSDERSDKDSFIVCLLRKISIHAPTNGATACGWCL